MVHKIAFPTKLMIKESFRFVQMKEASKLSEVQILWQVQVMDKITMILNETVWLGTHQGN
jgi:hypothetical protein